MPEEGWPAALAYALTGEHRPVAAANPGEVLAEVGGPDRVREIADRRRSDGEAWPWPIARPSDVGPAQWSAMITAVVRQIERGRAATAGRVLHDRAPDLDEVRLLRDVPPHHGG